MLSVYRLCDFDRGICSLVTSQFADLAQSSSISRWVVFKFWSLSFEELVFNDRKRGLQCEPAPPGFATRVW